ncbi:MAG: hypothetical protein Q7J86_06525 [Bacteroidota bacterium]|nr:hypothetical protein [Bacteroidota bacterium]MDP3435213.1 hypothetical protein [Bacteroidota bacterium]
MSIEKNQVLTDLLQNEWQLLLSAVFTLQLSIHKCQSIGIKEYYSFEELESFDSLTSKFNRTSDIFTQKVMRTVWMLLHEPFIPFIDMVNKAEKMLMLRSADAIIEIRDMRNQIAHEYIPEAIRDLVPEVIELTSRLIENIEDCRHFIESRNWIKPT